MLNYATSNYDVERYMRQGDIIRTLEDVLMQPSRYHIVIEEDINILKRKGEKIGEVIYEVHIDNLKIRIDEVIGTLDVYYNGKLYKTVNLSIQEEVRKSTIFNIVLEMFKEIFLVS